MKNVSKISIVSAMLLNAVFCINGYSMNKLDNTIEQNKQIEEISITMDINELIKRITHIIINNENKTNEIINENTAKELFPSLDHYTYNIYNEYYNEEKDDDDYEYIGEKFNQHLNNNEVIQIWNDLLKDNIKFVIKYDVIKNKEIKALFIKRWEELYNFICCYGTKILSKSKLILTDVLPYLGINDFEPLRENNIKNNNYNQNYMNYNNNMQNFNNMNQNNNQSFNNNMQNFNNMNPNNNQGFNNMQDLNNMNMMHHYFMSQMFQNFMNYCNQQFNNMQNLNNMYNMNQNYNNQYQNNINFNTTKNNILDYNKINIDMSNNELSSYIKPKSNDCYITMVPEDKQKYHNIIEGMKINNNQNINIQQMELYINELLKQSISITNKYSAYAIRNVQLDNAFCNKWKEIYKKVVDMKDNALLAKLQNTFQNILPKLNIGWKSNFVTNNQVK